MRTSFNEVLGQLEDLRLAEWADQAPPPPSHPSRPSPHTYANYPTAQGQRPKKSYSDSEPIYQPGQYAVRLNTLCIVSNFFANKIIFCSHQAASVIRKAMTSTTLLGNIERK